MSASPLKQSATAPRAFSLTSRACSQIELSRSADQMSHQWKPCHDLGNARVQHSLQKNEASCAPQASDRAYLFAKDTTRHCHQSPGEVSSMCFFCLLSIAHHHERVLAKNGAQFRRMMDDEWYAQTGKQACHPEKIFHFTTDEDAMVLLFKMPL